jgi:hypothetical protein
MANALMDRLKKNSTISESAILEDSIYYDKVEITSTHIPILNVLQSGEVDGGFGPGLTLWCGPSKHFKTGFLLINVKAYLDKFKDAICIFYDSEFGTPQAYFRRNGIDPSRVLHVPVTNIEDLKFDMVAQLEGLKRGDHVFFAIDSLGNLASKKEVEDAKDMKSVADMTRAKAAKSLGRIVTPMLTMKNLPCHAIQHTYETMEMFSKQVVSGGTGWYYSANNIYILGRQQSKTGEVLDGWNFVVNVDKSRYVREKSKILVTVKYDSGVDQFSGLLDVALEFELVTKPKNGYYTRPSVEGDKNWREKDTHTEDFWAPIWKNTDFAKIIRAKYRLPEEELDAPTVEISDVD